MNFTGDLLRFVIGGASIGVFVSFLVSLISQKKRTHTNIIESSIVSNIVSAPPLFKEKQFLKMNNAGENLCEDDIKFEFLDYCGNKNRMYYNNGGEANDKGN